MDEINDFMDFSKPFERVSLPPPPNNIQPDPNVRDVEIRASTSHSITGQRNPSETNYANQYKKQEMDRMIDVKCKHLITITCFYLFSLIFYLLNRDSLIFDHHQPDHILAHHTQMVWIH